MTQMEKHIRELKLNGTKTANQNIDLVNSIVTGQTLCATLYDGSKSGDSCTSTKTPLAVAKNTSGNISLGGNQLRPDLDNDIKCVYVSVKNKI